MSSDASLKDMADKLRATVTWTPAAEDGKGDRGGSAGGLQMVVSAGPSGRIDLRAHEEVFREIPASAELLIELYAVKGTEQPLKSTPAEREMAMRRAQQAAAKAAAPVRPKFGSGPSGGGSAPMAQGVDRPSAAEGAKGAAGGAGGGGRASIDGQQQGGCGAGSSGGAGSGGAVAAAGGVAKAAAGDGAGPRPAAAAPHYPPPHPPHPSHRSHHHVTHHVTFSSGQFAGCVRVPLLLTWGREKQQEWPLSLERKAGKQLVRGQLVASFEWSVTQEGTLMREVAALEQILAEKVELLAMLNPMPTSVTAAFMRPPGKQCRQESQSEPAGAASTAAVTAAVATAAAETLTDPSGFGAGGTSTMPLNLFGTAPAGFGGAAPPLGRTASVSPAGLVALGLAPAASSAPTTPARAMSESYFLNLDVSVMEVTGLLPREGVRASVAGALYGRTSASPMVATNMLPRAEVAVTCAGETRTASAGQHSVHPRFPKNTLPFRNVALGSAIKLQVFDHLSASYSKLLAEAELRVSDVPGTDPIYAWLPMPRRKRSSRSQKMLAMLQMMEQEGERDICVLVRIKIHKPQVHGMLAAVTLDLKGIGLCAKTNMEELLRFTMQTVRGSCRGLLLPGAARTREDGMATCTSSTDRGLSQKAVWAAACQGCCITVVTIDLAALPPSSPWPQIRASLVQTRTELQAYLAVQTIQLDNQMLEATKPVVLSPADTSHAGRCDTV